MEKHVSKICLALDRNQVVQVLALILAEQAIMPWLLHCENRVKEKFHVLLQCGILRDGDADGLKCRWPKPHFAINRRCQKLCIGRLRAQLPTNHRCRFPLSQDKKSVEKKNLKELC